MLICLRIRTNEPGGILAKRPIAGFGIKVALIRNACLARKLGQFYSNNLTYLNNYAY